MRDYIAFISYRHKDLDQAVALKVHRLLERYTIPRALRKNNEKKLGYVFRDVDELPLSSDLSESIREALDHSEYFVVIATPDYVRSKWCMLELEYFLKNHNLNHVLTVLASGTPGASFPELLRERDEEGNVIAEREPLAANIVSKSKRATLRLLDTEYLRFVAALLNCAYDTLARREQRYRTQRILTVFGSLLFIACVFIGSMMSKNAIITQQNNDLLEANNNIQIQNKLLEEDRDRIALQNRDLLIADSNMLARDATEALEHMDRLSAIELALRALPSAEQDRPWVPEAERILTTALGAYDTGAYGSLVRVETLNQIRNVFPVHDRKVITVGENYLLTYMDLQTGHNFWSKSLTQILKQGTTVTNPQDIVFDADGEYMWFIMQQSVFCVRLSDGELIWEDPYTGFMPFAQLAVKDDKLYLLWIDRDCMKITEYEFSNGVCIARNTVDSVGKQPNWVYTQTSASGDGFVLATDLKNESTEIAFVGFDGSNRVITTVPEQMVDKANVHVNDAQVIITFPDGIEEETAYGTFVKNDRLTVTCISDQSHDVLWQTTAKLATADQLQYKEIHLTDHNDTLVLSIGANILAFSKKNGECIASHCTQSLIIGHKDTAYNVLLFLRDGHVDAYNYAADYLFSEMTVYPLTISDTIEQVIEAKDGTTAFICASDKWALRTFDWIADPQYGSVAQFDVITEMYISTDAKKLFRASAQQDRDAIEIYDLQGHVPGDECPVPSVISQFLGADKQGNMVSWKDHSQSVFLTDLRTGKTELLGDLAYDGLSVTRQNRAGEIENILVKQTKNGSVTDLTVDCFVDGTNTKHIAYPVEIGFSLLELQELCVSDNAIAVLFQPKNIPEWVIWDRTTENEWHLSGPQYGKPSRVAIANGRPVIAFANSDGTVRLTDFRNDAELWRSEPFFAGITWMSFTQNDERLIIITGDNDLIFMDTQTGTAQKVGTLDSDFTTMYGVIFQETGKEILLYTPDGICNGSVTDLETMAIRTEIPHLCGFLPDENIVLVSYSGRLVTYPRYSLDELIQWGQDVIKLR